MKKTNALSKAAPAESARYRGLYLVKSGSSAMASETEDAAQDSAGSKALAAAALAAPLLWFAHALLERLHLR